MKPNNKNSTPSTSPLWPLAVLRWKSFKLNGRKIDASKLLIWWVITIWVSLVVSTANANAAQVRSSAGLPSVQASGAVVALTAPAPGGKPLYAPECNLGIALVILVIGAIIIGVLLYVLCALGFCGNRGNQPPQSPSNNNGDNDNIKGKVVKDVLINTNTSLPATIFYLNNGVVISNSAGITGGSLPPFLSINGQPAPNGSEISTATPGITTPPSIALWAETNTFSDATLDPAHPYVSIYNFSLLTSTNLPGGWRELCTVIGWVNNNPSVPLVCAITYTNGVPVTTNWSQCYLNSFHQPTNIVVYGALPSLGVENPPGNALQVRPHDGPTLPGGGDGGTNGMVTPSTGQFYMLTANTNDIMTSWP